MASVADLLIRIQADTSAASTQITNINTQLHQIGQGITPGDSISASLTAARPAALAMVGAGMAIEGAFALAVNTAADFESSMSAIKAVMKPSDISLYGDAVRALALQLGKDLPVTASQAAAGINELVKAGIPLPAILGGAGEAAVMLSMAVGAPVAEAAALAAQAMNAFRVPASELAGVMDTVAAVVNASATDFTDLKFGLAMVAPVAAMVGLTFADTATALGLFANNGLRGSDAGTSLKTMLMNLTPATEKASAMMMQLGIITADGSNQFFDASGKMKDMASVADVLQIATAGLTEEQKLLAFRIMFGSDAIRAAAILSREGAAGYNELAASMAGMTVADMAATRMNNLKGSTQQLSGSIETASIALGTGLIPVIRSVTDAATALTNRFIELNPATQQVVAGTGLVAGALLGILGGIALAVPAIANLGVAFGAMGTAATTAATAVGTAGSSILATAGPIAAVAVPIAALVAALVLLGEGWYRLTEQFRGGNSILMAVADAMLGPVGAVASLHENVVKFQNIGGLSGIAQQAQAAWSTIGPAISGAISGVIGTLNGATSSVQSLAGSWLSALMPAVQTVSGFFSGTLIPLFQSVSNVVSALTNLVGTAAAGAWQRVLLPALQEVGTFLTGTFNPIWQSVSDRIAALRTGELALLSTFLNNTVYPVLRTVGNILTDTVIPAVNRFADAIWTNVYPIVRALVDDTITPLVNSFNSIGPTISTVTGFFNSFADSIRSITLPWFLTPGSPSPFELALQGILSVVQALVSAGNPLAWLNTLADWLTGGGLGGIGGTRTVTVNVGQIIVRTTAEGDELVLALEEAFRVLLAGADSTEGASPSLAGAG